MQNADKKVYEKKVVYLDYLERGEKIKNGGYLKWEVKGDISRVEIHIRGLYPTDTLQGGIRLISYEETLAADKMMIHFGTGAYVAQWNNQNLAETGMSLEECDGVEVRLSENRMLRGRWCERKRTEVASETVVEKIESAPGYTAEVVEEPESAEEVAEESGYPEEEVKEIAPEVMAEEEEPVCEKKADDTEEYVLEASVKEQKEEAKEEAKKEPKREPVLVSDKWEQLNCYYPKIHPFGDKREYLSITPRDFVVLSGKYHNLVHNSFLLHGYYNYGHVVLAKLREGQEDVYYLGVPGVYFDREKQAALLFGFEGFEADCDRITDGGFGYYMKKVEI